MLGGSSLYHIQSILIFMSCLILFDINKEKLHILIGFPFIVACIAIGEFNVIDVPDFSNHWWNEVAKIANISSLLTVSTLLITFITRLNAKNENDLTKALSQLQTTTKELVKGKENLELQVQERTSKLEEKRKDLLKQNEEKIVLLKEVHHRVKNNLQIIISLINFQLIKIDNIGAQQALKEVQNRIHSMSLVHQKMYQTSNFKEIILGDYTEGIIDNISSIFNDKEFEYTINMPQEIKVDIEIAIPTGLIINEIITNFFKHNTHVNGTPKSFYMEIVNVNGSPSIIYKDNGKGFPDGIQLDETKSLGLQLIDTLSEQLDGSFKFYSDNGAVYEVSMPAINK